MGNKVTFYFNSFLHLSIFWKGHWYFILIVQLFKSNLLSNSWTPIQSRLTFTAMIDHWRSYVGWRHTLEDSSYNTSLLWGTEKGWKNKLYTYNCGPSLSARGTLIVGWYNPTIRGWVPHPTSWYPLHFLSFSTNHSFIHDLSFYKSVQFLSI